MSITSLLATLESSVDNFQGSIDGIQDDIFDEILDELRNLNTRAGTIKATVGNLKILNRLQPKIQKAVLTPEYRENVKVFSGTFDTLTAINNEYFTALVTSFKPSAVVNELRLTSIASTIESLTEAGINSNIVEPVMDIVRRNITEQNKVSNLVKELGNFITENEQSVGALRRYTSQITTDAVNQYSASQQKILTDDLGLEWFKYVGSLVKDSRPFCISLIKKKFVHKSELQQVAVGKFTIPMVRLNGLIPNTNASNLQVNRGGFQCQHQLIAVATEEVPKAVQKRIGKKIPLPSAAKK